MSAGALHSARPSQPPSLAQTHIYTPRMDVVRDTSDELEHRASVAHIVLPGEVITDDPTCMRGHGTYILEGKIIASVAGVVERIGKLVSVKPLRSR